MNYKFKICNNDIFGSEDLEKQLNQMAAQGYELILSSLSGVPIACYEKTERATRKHYSVELIRKDDTGLLQFCKDAGWKLLIHSKNEQCIFVTEEEDIVPIFSDSVSRYEYAAKVVYYNSTVGCSIGIFLGAASFLGILTWFINLAELWMLPLKLMIGAGWLVLALGIGQIFANYFYMRRTAKRIDIEGVMAQPSILRIWNRLNFYLLIIMLGGTWAFYIIKNFILVPDILAGLIIFFAPILFIVGLALRAIRGDKRVGTILMFIGVWLIMGGIRLMEDLL